MKKVFKFIDQFLDKLIKEAIFLIVFLFILTFGVIVVTVLWNNDGLTGKVILIVACVWLIGTSFVGTVLKFKNEKLDKELNEAVGRHIDLLSELTALHRTKDFQDMQERFWGYMHKDKEEINGKE
jgi:hypothetical protein